MPLSAWNLSAGGEHLKHAVGKIKDGDVEGAAAQVEDEDALIGALLVKAIGKRGRGGLIHDTLDVEASNFAGVLRSLTLSVVKVGRHGDDGVGNGLAQILLGVGLHLLKNHGADLLGGVVLTVDVRHGTAALALNDLVRHRLDLGANLAVLTAHETLDGEDGVLGVGDSLVLCGLANNAVAVGAEAHNGRRGAVALGVNNNGGVATLKYGHRRVGGTKVDTKNLVTHG